MKYVVLQGPGGPLPVLFGHGFAHRAVARALGGEAGALSAGFVRLEAGRIECSGFSSSLGIASRPDEDSRLVARHLAAEED